MEEKRRNGYTIIAIAALVAILLGCVAGGLAGGLAGFLVGQRAGRSAADRALSGALADLQQLRGQTSETWSEEQPIPEPRSEEETRPSTGALVLEVVPGTAADEAGLEAGDILIAIDRTAINRNHPLPDIITQYKPGDRVTVHFWRAGQQDSVRVTLGRHPDEPNQAYFGVYFREMPELQFERPLD